MPAGVPSALRADYRRNPIGLDEAPLLSWQPPAAQEEFEIELRTAGDAVARYCGSSRHPRFQFPGTLEPLRAYEWRVRVRTDRTWGRWSETAVFESGPLCAADWHGARWIGADAPGPSPSFSVRFDAEPGPGLRLFLSALGVGYASLNGRAVGDGILDPPPSAYDSVVFYRAFDVSALIAPGSNRLQVRLGRGFFGMRSATTFGWHTAPWHAEPRMLALLTDLDDPERPLVTSGAEWRMLRTPVVEDSFYTGEVVDFPSAQAESAATVVSPPAGALRSCSQPPVTRRGHVEVTAVRRLAPDRVRFDLAQNVAGIVSVSTEDRSLPTLTVKLGEHLDADGHVVASDGAIPGELQSNTVIAPAGVRVDLDLSYAGLRYAEVSGSDQDVRLDVDRISAAPRRVGTFECSDERLNAISAASTLTFENCLQGTPIDTPLYEKQGYTGDAQLLAESYAYTFWMPNSLTSWLQASVLPSQHADGSIPGIAPAPPGDWIFDTPSPAWDAALLELPATLLRHYGDLATVRRALPSIRRYLDFLTRRFPDGIIDVGLGDWNAPGHVMPPEPPAIVSTAYHHRFLTLAARFLTLLGDPAAAASLSNRADAVRDAFNTRFWRADGWYAHPDFGAYRETDNVIALAFGLVPGSRRLGLMHRIHAELDARGRHLDTGIVGTKFLLRTLARSSRPGLAYDVARNPDYPGWQYWLSHGATTLYENWELDGRSHNHAMFGTIQEWLFADVAGMAPATPGWDAITIAPRLPPGERFECDASLETLAGTVSAAWTSDGVHARGRVVAPAHVELRVPHAPAAIVGTSARGANVEYTITAPVVTPD